MNRWIADSFSFFIAVIHIFFIAGLALSLIGILVNDPRTSLAGEMGISRGSLIASVFGAFMLYVLIMGTISTLIAINQNLERIARTAETITKDSRKEAQSPSESIRPAKAMTAEKTEPQFGTWEG